MCVRNSTHELHELQHEVRKRVNPKRSGQNLWTAGERTDTNYKYITGELSVTNLILLRANPDFNFVFFLTSGWVGSFRLLTLLCEIHIDYWCMQISLPWAVMTSFFHQNCFAAHLLLFSLTGIKSLQNKLLYWFKHSSLAGKRLPMLVNFINDLK